MQCAYFIIIFCFFSLCYLFPISPFVNNIQGGASFSAFVLRRKNLVEMVSSWKHLWKSRSGDFYFCSIKALFNKIISHYGLCCLDKVISEMRISCIQLSFTNMHLRSIKTFVGRLLCFTRRPLAQVFVWLFICLFVPSWKNAANVHTDL